MKIILAVIVVLFTVNISFAAFTVPATAEKPLVETKEQRERKLMEMIMKMSVKDYESLTGKKMNFVERLAFKMEKKRFEKQ